MSFSCSTDTVILFAILICTINCVIDKLGLPVVENFRLRKYPMGTVTHSDDLLWLRGIEETHTYFILFTEFFE